jgi:hypothetical protein
VDKQGLMSENTTDESGALVGGFGFNVVEYRVDGVEPFRGIEVPSFPKDRMAPKVLAMSM